MAQPKHPRLSLLLPLPLHLFLFCFVLYQTFLAFAADTISANHGLSGDQKLTSRGGNFALGFFMPGDDSSPQGPHFYYIGIWYNKVSQLTPVWVANRETPVTDPSASELKINDDGNLVLLDQSKSIIWSTTALISANSSRAVLLDTGNLQLRDDSNTPKVLWQSTDHPTNTWLPGAKLGLNKLNRTVQRITSWKNSADPSPGIFSLELDPNGTSQFYLLWNMTKLFWSSGPWNGHYFTSIPEMNNPYISIVYEFVNDDRESYFTYSLKNDSIIKRSTLDATGQLNSFMWLESDQKWVLYWSSPKQKCQVYTLCGAFGSCNENSPVCRCLKGFSVKYPCDWELNDKSGGCVRNAPLQCNSSSLSNNSKKDRFYMMPNMRLPDNSHKFATGSSEDCQFACLNSCFCTAFSYNSSGCFVWYGDLLNLQEQYDGSDAGTLYLRLAASEFPKSETKKRTVTLVIASFIGCLIVASVFFGLKIWRHRSRGMGSAGKAVGGNLVPFRYCELRHATKNFSERLGGGGFGSVFKGTLPDSTSIAVKKLEGLRQGEKQFRAEVSTIGTVQHVNLARLRGFCSEGNKKLLVYEYMARGSLDKLLFRSSSSTVLGWRTRYQIMIGIARGLEYLHEKCRDCIIHCDIKPENILLDECFVPKVADFGLAKLLGRDFSRVLTTMRGTIGYLAPEWICSVPITAKADVYSYGMMLFEIISGRRNSEQTEQSGAVYFPALVAGELVAGNVQSLWDHRMSGDVDLEELERACRVACWCIQDNEHVRPSMALVVQALERFVEVNMPPIPRSLQVLVPSPEKLISDCPSNQTFWTCSTTSTTSNLA